MADIKWRKLIDKAISVASEAADVAVHLSSNPGPVAWVSVTAKVVNAVNQLSAKDLSEFFVGWTKLEGVHPLGDFLFILIKEKQLFTEEETSSKNPGYTEKVLTATVNNVRIGYIDHDNWKEGPYLEPGANPHDAVHALRIFTWECMGGCVKYKHPPMGSPYLVRDVDQQTFASKTAQNMWLEHKQFIQQGKKRSVLFYGEPGVGKSNIVRYIADQAGGLRLRLRARDLESMSSLGHLINFLQPSAVIIDDLCRAKDKNGILEEFDEVMSKANLFLVTANFINKLDPAVIRRFDDTHLVDKLDDEVLDYMLKGVDNKAIDKLKSLPISYIAKYKEMHECLGANAALQKLDALVSRRATVLKMMKEYEPEPDILLVDKL